MSTYTSSTIFKIPILREGDKITPAYVAELKEAIQSDGCTCVTEKFQDCCVVHDLGYEFNIDPWGRTVERKDVDKRFRKCMEDASFLGKLFSRWRYPAVRIFGIFFDHPEVEDFDIYIFQEPIK